MALQLLDVAIQARQFTPDARFQPQRLQGQQQPAGTIAIGVHRQAVDQIRAQAAEPGLRPQEGHAGLGQAEVVFRAWHARDDRRQKQRLAVRVDGIAFAKLQRTPTQTAHKGQQYAANLIQQHAGRVLMMQPGEIFHPIDDQQPRPQAFAIVGIHGVQRPCLQEMAVHACQLAAGAHGEAVGDLNVGGADALGPAEQEVLLLAGPGGDVRDDRFEPVEGELHLQPFFEQAGDLFRKERRV